MKDSKINISNQGKPTCHLLDENPIENLEQGYASIII